MRERYRAPERVTGRRGRVRATQRDTERESGRDTEKERVRH